jgi:hypothetical protein
MRATILLTCLVVAGFTLRAQTKVLEMEVPTDSMAGGQSGENRRHFVHMFFDGGLIADIKNPSGNYDFLRSFNSGLGVLYKLKFTEWLSTGLEVELEHYTYRLKDDRPGVFPDTVLHDKEKVQQMLISGSYFIRLNMDDRGNTMGKFFDMGMGGGLQIGSRYLAEDELPGGQIREVKIRKYEATLPNTWYLFGRLGVNNMVLFGKYRMQGLFKPEMAFPAAPDLTIGLRLCFH